MLRDKPQFSIRYKFLLVTTALLVTCVGAYLFLATDEFKSDKKSLVFDFNQSLVWNISSDLESFFSSLNNKIRMVAYLYRESEQKRKGLVQDFLQDQNDLVFIAGSDSFERLDQFFYVDRQYLSTYKLAPEFFDKEMSNSKPIPFEKIKSDGQAIWNATAENAPPLIGIGRTVIEEDARGLPLRQFAVIAYVKADRIIKNLEQSRPNEVYIRLGSGEMLVHPNAKMMMGAKTDIDALFALAEKAQIKKQVAEFQDLSENYLGAFAKALGGKLIVMSKISEKQAFQAVNKLVIRSLLFASTIVTLAFLVAIFFSQSLTKPIDVLMKGMGKVSEGDLSGQIDVHSKDEIALLAGSFNRMIHDLRESREELELINKDLENKVRERTKELEAQNRAVKEAQEALLRTTRLAAVGEVAGQAAHEVLNPLTSIISRLNKVKARVRGDRIAEAQVLLDINNGWKKDYSEGGFPKLLQSWNAPSQVQTGARLWDEDIQNMTKVGESIIEEFKSLTEDTEFLISESERIGRIINSFRSLSTNRGEPKKVSIHELCDRSIKIMADLAQRDGHKIICEFNANLDTALLDEDEFIQVMTNLIRNGLQSVTNHHKQSGLGRLKISTELNSSNIEIHICDNGGGIQPEFRERLFEKNFTTKSKSEGTGIGLSISRRLIRAFHGDIKLADNEIGSEFTGAHFVIELPLINEDTNESPSSEKNEGAA